MDELLDNVASLEITSASPLLVIKEIYIFGSVCTGLDEVLDRVASLEDYLCQSTPCH